MVPYSRRRAVHGETIWIDINLSTYYLFLYLNSRWFWLFDNKSLSLSLSLSLSSSLSFETPSSSFHARTKMPFNSPKFTIRSHKDKQLTFPTSRKDQVSTVHIPRAQDLDREMHYVLSTVEIWGHHVAQKSKWISHQWWIISETPSKLDKVYCLF